LPFGSIITIHTLWANVLPHEHRRYKICVIVSGSTPVLIPTIALPLYSYPCCRRYAKAVSAAASFASYLDDLPPTVALTIPLTEQEHFHSEPVGSGKKKNWTSRRFPYRRAISSSLLEGVLLHSIAQRSAPRPHAFAITPTAGPYLYECSPAAHTEIHALGT